MEHYELIFLGFPIWWYTAPAIIKTFLERLFGENWNHQDIDTKTRCIVTVVALMASGITDSALSFHLKYAKENGVTQKEMAAIITQVAFYAGWTKGWAVFRLAQDIWKTDDEDFLYEDEAMKAHAGETIFPIGEPNRAYAEYFTGQSYLFPVSDAQPGIHHITFEPGCRNHWHIHHASEGGGQILLCVGHRS